MRKPTFTWLTVVSILAIFEVACAPKPSESSPSLPVITPAALPSPSEVARPASISPDLLRQIGKQTPILTRGDQDTSERLSRGDYPMALQVAYTYMATYAREGAPVKAIPMAEGVTRSTLLLSPIKGAPHPNAARIFLDWILSSEGQTVLHKTRATPPAEKGCG